MSNVLSKSSRAFFRLTSSFSTSCANPAAASIVKLAPQKTRATLEGTSAPILAKSSSFLRMPWHFSSTFANTHGALHEKHRKTYKDIKAMWSAQKYTLFPRYEYPRFAFWKVRRVVVWFTGNSCCRIWKSVCYSPHQQIMILAGISIIMVHYAVFGFPSKLVLWQL